ncbi:MAG: hypothetical protein ACYC77_09720 [Coriobacteriia bacterium]
MEHVRPGDHVWTTMQGLGGVRAERDGGHAEYVTAYMGLRRLGDLAGRTLIVTGPEGGVGSMAVLLATELGARLVEHDRNASPLRPRMAVKGRIILVP